MPDEADQPHVQNILYIRMYLSLFQIIGICITIVQGELFVPSVIKLNGHF